MWTIYGQSLVLLLCEEMILKAWTNSGHTLYIDKLWTYLIHGQILDKICIALFVAQGPLPIAQILDKTLGTDKLCGLSYKM